MKYEDYIIRIENAKDNVERVDIVYESVYDNDISPQEHSTLQDLIDDYFYGRK